VLCAERMDETTFMYLTCDLPAPPLYPDEMRENIIPQVPLFGILNKFNGLVEKEYKTYKDSTLKRFEITQLPPFIILYIKVNSDSHMSSFIHSFISLLPTNVKTHSPLHMTKTYYDYVTR